MYDLVIRDARILDGTGGPAFDGDLGVAGEQIVALGARLVGEARGVRGTEGGVAAPGCLDAHTHDDLAVLRSARVVPQVQQGIASLVIGNCGFGVAPVAPANMAVLQRYAAPVLGEDDQPWDWLTMGSYLETLRALPLGQHVRALLGHAASSV